MIHDYASTFSIDPDIAELKDVRKLYENWAIEGNKNAATFDRMDNQK